MQVNRVSRAKQFLPFDALKGFKEELRKKEIEYEERKELSEETLLELNNIFNKIEKGSYVTIKYYKDKKYIIDSGALTSIDYVKKKIQIDHTRNINISDIIEIINIRSS